MEAISIGSDELLDEVNYRIRLIQKKEGLRFGTDALLLASYIGGRNGARAVELGGGSGIISLLCLAKEKFDQPNFEFFIVKDKGHNPQYSYSGLAIMKEYNEKMSHLATEEEKDECKRSTDFLAMGELDGEIMERVVAHIK